MQRKEVILNKKKNEGKNSIKCLRISDIEFREIMTRTKLNNVMQLAIHGTDKGFSLTSALFVLKAWVHIL